MGWNERLSKHFRELKKVRTRTSSDARVFAIEHGLSKDEITELGHFLSDKLHESSRREKLWLPAVVVAAEAGYKFAGDEYWRIFEKYVENWSVYGDRHWLRNCFEKFERDFLGAKPAGSWAKRFRIIAWPVTHAIIPIDLQRQFLDAMYRLRQLLRDDHFSDKALLAKTIENRTNRMTDRFRNFLRNDQLVWQLSCALFTEELGVNNNLIQESTLSRLIVDLEKERTLKARFRATRRQANKLVVRGAQSLPRKRKSRGRQVGARAGSLSPTLRLKRLDDGSYDLYVDIPNFGKALGDNLKLKEDVSKCRCLVAGSKRTTPLPASQFLHSRRKFRLSNWPECNTPIMRPVGFTDTGTKEFFENIRVRSEGGIYLFKIGADSDAFQIKSGYMKDGETYVIAANDPCDLPEGGEKVIINCPPMSAVRLSDLSREGSLKKFLEKAKIGYVSHLDIWPAGVCPVQWDETGTIEWLTTDNPIIGVRSRGGIERVVLKLLGTREPPLELRLKDGASRFVQLPKLYSGNYCLNVVSDFGTHNEEKSAASIAIVIREPENWEPGSNNCNPLLLQMDPLNPSYEQLWNGSVELDIQGPIGLPIEFYVRFKDRRGKEVYVAEPISGVLPVGAADWNRLFTNIQTCLKGETDRANVCEVVVEGNELGKIKLNFERQISALRWSVLRQKTQYDLRLIDDTDSINKLQAHFYSGAHPDIVTDVDYQSLLDGIKVKKENGLFCARANGNRAGVIVRSDERSVSSFQSLKFESNLSKEFSKNQSLSSALELVELWAKASTSDDLWTDQLKRSCINVLTRGIFECLGGELWGKLENFYEDGPERIALKRMRENLSVARKYNYVAYHIRNGIDEVSKFPISQRVFWFANAVERYKLIPRKFQYDYVVWYSEFCLRLASDPGHLKDWAGNRFSETLVPVEKKSIVPLLARYLVLSVDESLKEVSTRSAGTLYLNWKWSGI